MLTIFKNGKHHPGLFNMKVLQVHLHLRVFLTPWDSHDGTRPDRGKEKREKTDAAGLCRSLRDVADLFWRAELQHEGGTHSESDAHQASGAHSRSCLEFVPTTKMHLHARRLRRYSVPILVQQSP